MSHVARWGRRRIAGMLASQELSAFGVIAACEAMHRLNQYAKWCDHELQKWEIYDLKRRLVGELLEQFPCEVAAAVNRLPCHSCDGTGIWSRWAHYAALCWKCGGTGTYREHQMLRFTFLVSGRRYSWHQPAEFWPNIVATEHDGEYESDRSATLLTNREYELSCETVGQWVESQGLALNLPARRPGTSLYWSIRYDLSTLRTRALYRWRSFRLALAERISATESSELPF